MAGFVIGVGRTVGSVDLLESLDTMRRHATTRSCVLHTEAGCAIGASHRAGDPPGVAVDVGAGLALAVVGRPVDRARRRVVDADHLLAGLATEGVRYLTGLDGGFVIVALNRRTRRLTLVNDRMATIPVHVVRQDGFTAIAPEGKVALRLAGCRPRLDAIGALEFTAFGHAVGTRTLLADVRLLEPASHVTLELDSGSYRGERYWDLRFAPHARASGRSAAAELDERLEEAVRAAVSPSAATSQLLLTGGFDSRTLLAYLERADHLPDRALSWGTTADRPGSDTVLARRIAARFSVPFTFVPYGHTTLAERAHGWAAVSELASDNLGNFAAGPNLLLDDAGDPPLTFIGDHMFGAGGFPLNDSDAIEAGAGVPGDLSLPAGLRAIVRHDAHAATAEAAFGGLRVVIARHAGGEPKDLQDYLGMHLRVARWLNAPTYFREPILAVSRPMLHAPIVDLFAELPASLRVDRKLQVQLLRRRFPDLLRIPVATVSSLIDWDAAFRGDGAAAHLLASLLAPDRLAVSPLADVLDIDAVAQRHAAFIARPPRVGPARTARWLPRLRRAASGSRAGSLALRSIQRWTTRSLGRSVGVTTERALIRVGLLNLFSELLERGELSAANGATAASSTLAAPSWWRA